MLRRLWPILLICLAPLLVLWRCVFLGEAIGPWQEVRTFAPWSEAAPNRPFDVLQMDAALQFYVWRDLVFESWGRGQVPLWNPYSLGGTPLLANSQSAALYPLHILMGVLHVSTALAITLLAWFHLAWAGLGVAALGRKLGGDPNIAAMAGMSVSLSAFMVSWTGLSSVITTVAWIPWCFFALVCLWNDEHPRRAAGWLSGSVAMMFLGGHLQFAAFGMMALVMFGAISAWEWRANGQRVGWAFLGLGLGGVLASPHLVPVLQFSQFSHRRGAPTAAGWEAYASSGLRWWELASIGSGDLLGSSAKFAPDELKPLSNFWPTVLKLGANYAESAIAVGAVVLAFAMIALFSRQRGAWSLLGVVVIGLLIATASPFAQALYFGFPGWSSTGSPGRAAILVVLGLACLAATVKLGESGADLRKHPIGRGLLAGFAVAGLGAVALRLNAPRLTPVYEQFDATAMARLVESGLGQFGGVTVIVATLLLLGYAISRKPEQAATYALVLGFVALLPGLLSAPLRTGIVPPRPPAAPESKVAMLNRNWSLFDYSPRTVMPPNLAALYRIKEVGGYDSLVNREDVEFMRRLNGGEDPAPPANGNMMFVKSPFNITTADASEVWSGIEIPGWESQLIEQKGDFRRYRVIQPGDARPEKTQPATPNFAFSVAGLAALGYLLRPTKRPRALE